MQTSAKNLIIGFLDHESIPITFGTSFAPDSEQDADLEPISNIDPISNPVSNADSDSKPNTPLLKISKQSVHNFSRSSDPDHYQNIISSSHYPITLHFIVVIIPARFGRSNNIRT